MSQQHAAKCSRCSKTLPSVVSHGLCGPCAQGGLDSVIGMIILPPPVLLASSFRCNGPYEINLLTHRSEHKLRATLRARWRTCTSRQPPRAYGLVDTQATCSQRAPVIHCILPGYCQLIRNLPTIMSFQETPKELDSTRRRSPL
nr:hypothetical protein CFP56_04573 [Quercus suber]POE63680.1 hypothetical protein CFP56_04583 [Quercus suber]